MTEDLVIFKGNAELYTEISREISMEFEKAISDTAEGVIARYDIPLRTLEYLAYQSVSFAFAKLILNKQVAIHNQKKARRNRK